MSNAIKFTKQGHVFISVSLEDKDDIPWIRFDVEDTSIGIPKEKQQDIFESFTQADDSTSRRYGGTGLGLAITKQLAELLGGELTLTSEPGEGSTFSLALPIGLDITNQPLLSQDNAYDQAADKSQQTETPSFSGTVLVAEDIEGSQELMKIMLSRLGVDVVVVEDGHQAIQKALSHSFDLILMDMQMPNMNGYEATRILKQQGYETPIVALTAHAVKGDDQACLEAGCDEYLAKPVDHKELPGLLAQYLPVRQRIESTAAQS